MLRGDHRQTLWDGVLFCHGKSWQPSYRDVNDQEVVQWNLMFFMIKTRIKTHKLNTGLCPRLEAVLVKVRLGYFRENK